MYFPKIPLIKEKIILCYKKSLGISELSGHAMNYTPKPEMMWCLITSFQHCSYADIRITVTSAFNMDHYTLVLKPECNWSPTCTVYKTSEHWHTVPLNWTTVFVWTLLFCLFLFWILWSSKIIDVEKFICDFFSQKHVQKSVPFL